MGRAILAASYAMKLRRTRSNTPRDAKPEKSIHYLLSMLP